MMSWPVFHETRVERGWVDYNGHMNVAWYVLAFDRGTDGLLDRLGLGAAYQAATRRTIYVVEAHVSYLSEAKEGEPLVVETLLVGADAKRLHLFHRMRRGRGGPILAENELLCLHVAQGRGQGQGGAAGPKAAPFDDEARGRIDALLAGQRGLERPERLGRAIQLLPAR
jgi:acyl-CoA thioester hydrolase